MNRAEELPNRKTRIEAGDIIEYMNKQYYVKAVTLADGAEEWQILTEDGSISEDDVELIHKRERNYD